MPRTTTIQTNFTAGELSPRLLGRVDIGKYVNAADTIENFIVTPHGGATRRSGTRYVGSAKQSDRKCRLVAFEFSTAQAYIVEFGHYYCRFFRNQGQIITGQSSASVGNGSFDSGISGWDDRSDAGTSIGYDTAEKRLNLIGAANKVAWAEQAVSTDSSGSEHVIRLDVFGDPRDKVEVRIGVTSKGDEILSDVEVESGSHTISFTPTSSPFYLQIRNNDQAKTIQIDDVKIQNATPIEITTPYREDELFELAFTQSADILYVAHERHAPRELSRGGHTTWSMTEFEFKDGPFLSMNTEAGKTLAPSATSGFITINASGFKPFTDTDVGRLVRIKHGGTWGYARITAYTSATQVSAEVKQSFNATSASADWRLGSWSETSGWPGAVTFFQERLWWGGTQVQPQTVWGSASGDFTNYQPTQPDDTVEDDDGLSFTIADDRVNAIRWMSAGKRLAIGTTGGEFTMAGGGGGEPVTPTQIQITRETTHGAARISAKRIGPVVLFAQRQRKKIREFVFNFDVDSFKAPDLVLLAEHVTGTGIVEMDYQQEPDSILWCVRDDGALLGMTYERDQDVVGWHRHLLGGVSDALGNKAACESVAVIPVKGRDETWLSVRRFIDGNVVRQIEVLEEEFDPDNAGHRSENAFYVDSGLSHDVPLTLLHATQSNPVRLTVADHGLANGDLIRVSDVGGMTELNQREFEVLGVLTSAVSGAADNGSGAIRLTAVGHGFQSDDSVTVSGVDGTIEANGTFNVTVIDADAFDLNGTSFTNAYTSGGEATGDSFGLVNEDGSNHKAYVSGGIVRRRVTSISGLGHLEGQTVAILGDGAVQPERTVVGGSITLARPAAIVHAGLPYVSKLKTLRPEGGNPIGSSQGLPKRVFEATVRFWNTIGGKFGPDDGSTETIPFRDASDPMSQGTPLFTGDKSVRFPGNWETTGQAQVIQDQPLPMTVLAVVKKLIVNEG